MIKLTHMHLQVSHSLLHSDSLSNLLVLTFTEAKATAPRYYNDNSLLESLNSKLQSFYYKPCGYTWWVSKNLVFPNDTRHL